MQIETPKPIRLLCLLLSVLTGVVALAGVALLPLSDDDRVWFGVAFQSFSLLASVYGVLVGLGRLKGTPALTMLTTGGMVFVAATLSEKSLSGLLANERVDPTTIGGVSVLPFALLLALAFFARPGHRDRLSGCQGRTSARGGVTPPQPWASGLLLGG